MSFIVAVTSIRLTATGATLIILLKLQDEGENKLLALPLMYTWNYKKNGCNT